MKTISYLILFILLCSVGIYIWQQNPQPTAPTTETVTPANPPEVRQQNPQPMPPATQPVAQTTTLAPADRQMVLQQLRECENHFQADRLTTGTGGTALECYDTVLKTDPTEPQAWAGLDKIEARYQDWILNAQARGQPNKVKRYQARLRKIAAVKAKFLPILQIDPGGHKALISDVAFTPDGRYLVSAGDDKVIRVWDLETGQTVRTLRGQIGVGDEGKIYAMALSPDGRWLAAGGMMATYTGDNAEEVGTIRLYNFASGQLVALLNGHTDVVLSLAFSPDSRFLVSGGGDFNALLWDMAESKATALNSTAKAKALDAILSGHTDDIYAVAFTADSQRVVTGSFDHTLRLWQVSDGKLLATLTGHTDKVYSVAISPQQDIIASGSWDYTIRLWDGQTGRFIKTLANQGTKVGSLSFSPDGQYLVSGVGTKGIGNDCYVWSIPDGQEIVIYREHDNVVIATAVSPDGRWVATGGGSNQEIHLWSLRNGHLKQLLRGAGASTWAVGFSADGRELAWGYVDPCPNEVSCPNKLGPLEYRLTLPKSDALEAFLVPRKITDGGSHFIRAQDVHGDWALRTRQGGNYGYQAILDIRHHDSTKASIERGDTDGLDHRSYTFTPNGQRIISGGSHGVLTAYNRDGDKLGGYVGHTGDVWAVAVSPDGQLLVSGSVDQTVRLWDVDSRENLLTLFHGFNGEWVAWTPTGHYTASPKGDEMVGWQINRGVDKAADYIKAAQLREHFYSPAIVANAIRWRDGPRAVAHAGGTPFRLAQLNVSKAPRFQIIAPPNHSTTRQGQLQVALSFVDTGEPLETLQAYVNGRLVDNLKKWALPQRRNSFEKTVTLPLQRGDNQIRIIAKNRLNLLAEQTVQVQYDSREPAQHGTLYLVAVGVSQYQNRNRSLRFAATDATAFHQTMVAQKGKRYQQVKHRLLADGATRPTAANIKQALTLFQQAGPQDTVVLFLSGHGEYDGRDYYFLPYDAKAQRNQWQPDSVIKWDVLQAALQEAKGRRVLLVDTCHAGGAINPRLIKDASDHEIIVLSATDTYSVAQELPELGHGVFTHALLKGLKGKADLMGDDNVISINELHTYLEFTIKTVTDGSQVPTSNTTAGFKNFGFVKY